MGIQDQTMSKVQPNDAVVCSVVLTFNNYLRLCIYKILQNKSEEARKPILFPNKLVVGKNLKYIFKRFYSFIFRKREGERKRRRGISMCERNIGWVPFVCSLTRN